MKKQEWLEWRKSTNDFNKLIAYAKDVGCEEIFRGLINKEQALELVKRLIQSGHGIEAIKTCLDSVSGEEIYFENVYNSLFSPKFDTYADKLEELMEEKELFDKEDFYVPVSFEYIRVYLRVKAFSEQEAFQIVKDAMNDSEIDCIALFNLHKRLSIGNAQTASEFEFNQQHNEPEVVDFNKTVRK